VVIRRIGSIVLLVVIIMLMMLIVIVARCAGSRCRRAPWALRHANLQWPEFGALTTSEK